MEAASARAAARDRWSDFGRAPSQLQRFISAACSPENYEPNLALDLEICDVINKKKGTAPREAATAIVGYINHRNPNVALLALTLLDICVKNCGYAFHLQISTKEFLNELVRRFPERPPIRPTRVQAKILEAIEEWRVTICETSRYKEDLGFIRDMHRLLSYKGYVFPEVRTEDAAVLNPSDNLKSPDEMEEEDREAQSAKLQELIRRGTPEDLREANRLMKVMAGYDTRSRTDYRAKAAEEISKVQAKARLLEERLAAFVEGDSMAEGDVFSELASALQSAQPKIQKMCEEETDDQEAVAKLLEINDSINRTIKRYKLMKKGDLEGAAKVAAGGPLLSSIPAKELSLIDLDVEATDANANKRESSQGLQSDLLGLELGGLPSDFGQGGSIALGLGKEEDRSSAANNKTGPSAGPVSPSPINQDSRGSSQTPPTMPRVAQEAQQPSPGRPVASVDPFAALGLVNTATTAAPPPPLAAAASGDDEEWNFASALLPETASSPKEHKSTVCNTSLRVDLEARRSSGASNGAGSNAIQAVFSFGNNTAQTITELHFQLAVPKNYELQLQPQTGRSLAPQQKDGVKQEVAIWYAGDRERRVESVKLRWRAAYKVGNEAKSETGEIAEFSIG